MLIWPSTPPSSPNKHVWDVLDKPVRPMAAPAGTFHDWKHLLAWSSDTTAPHQGWGGGVGRACLGSKRETEPVLGRWS